MRSFTELNKLLELWIIKFLGNAGNYARKSVDTYSRAQQIWAREVLSTVSRAYKRNEIYTREI